MIRYSLLCAQSHDFESWFQSSEAYETLLAAGHLACPVCGAHEVTKSLMAPSLSTPGTADLVKKTDVAAALTAMRHEVESKSEYVGMNFVTEARAIHDGIKPERAIYGEARVDEARKLMEDGVPVAPLPFLPKRKTN